MVVYLSYLLFTLQHNKRTINYSSDIEVHLRQRKTGSSPRSSGSSSRDHLQRRNHSKDKERERRRTVRIMMMLILILRLYLLVYGEKRRKLQESLSSGSSFPTLSQSPLTILYITRRGPGPSAMENNI